MLILVNTECVKSKDKEKVFIYERSNIGTIKNYNHILKNKREREIVLERKKIKKECELTSRYKHLSEQIECIVDGLICTMDTMKKNKSDLVWIISCDQK